jgi:membrane dipeptidase
MSFVLVAGLCLHVAAQTGAPATRPLRGGVEPDPLARARALHKQSPLIDGHNDYPWALRGLDPGRDLDQANIIEPVPSLMTDIPRLRRGGMGAQFWSVYVPSTMQGKEAVRATLEQIDIVHRMTKKWPETFELALTAADIERSFKAGRIGSLIGMEGGHSIDSSLAALRMMYSLGARYMTLTHSANVPWADASPGPAVLGGLSKFGEEVVREMNRLGMLVDLSHVSPDTMEDALRVTDAPVIFSHSSAKAICNVHRNVPDNILQMVAKNGGVVMVTFVPGFVSQAVADYDAKPAAERGSTPAPKATLAQVADHIDHIRKVAGIDHIGLGGDFDGITAVVVGLEDVSTYPALTAELITRGYKDEDIKKILGLNVLRVMKQAEQVAARLQKTRQPSSATIEQLDGK